MCGKIKRSNSYPQDHEPEVIKHIDWNLTENMEYQLHLSDYEVLHQLGSGSFSNVYHVKNKVVRAASVKYYQLYFIEIINFELDTFTLIRIRIIMQSVIFIDECKFIF